MDKIVLVGAGGHAVSVIDSIYSTDKYEVVGITDRETAIGENILGSEIIGDDNILQSLFDSGVMYAFVTVGSIGNTSLRERLFLLLKEIGFILPVIIDKSSNIGSNVEFGEGVYIGKNSIVNASSSIADMAIINTGAVVEHCCCIGEFSHIAPGAVLCGDVKIGARTHVGANATVIQGVHIGANSTVGAGSVVIDNVPSNCCVVGVPARIIHNN